MSSMLSKTRSTPVISTASGAFPDTSDDSVGDEPSVAAPNTARAREAAAAAAAANETAASGTETRAEHFRRKALPGDFTATRLQPSRSSRW